jgi:lipopolysaccharide transport system ATP-binding protein
MGYIRASGIIVDFPVYGGGSRSLKKTFIRAATGGTLAKDAADHLVIRALNNVSFEIREGDRVGLVGHNGSGKTTLLRVITGAYEPVSGEIEVRGRVASMLSVFLGMDSEATGLENLYLRGAFMGLRRHEVDALVPDIAEFSELGDYLEMPLRTYSSGMAMRLAFAMSTSVSADIVIMDEWLSVGDAQFSDKAEQRLLRMVDGAKILVLASHNDHLIRKSCNKILRLEHGELVSYEALAIQTPDRKPHVA